MYMIFNRNKLRDRLDDSTLRLLTETEIEWVAGGSGSYGSGGGYSDEIVVVGKRYKKNVQFNYWFLIDTGDTGSGYDYGDIPGMGYGGDPTPDPTPPPPTFEQQLEQQAKDYADKTVKHGEGFNPNNSDHVKKEQEVKEALKDLFKAAHDGVEGATKLTNGQTINDEQLRKVVDHLELTLQTKNHYNNSAGEYGVRRDEVTDERIHQVSIDLDARDVGVLNGNFNYLDKAMNFIALHEVGDALDYEFGTRAAGQDESHANYYALQLGQLSGIGMPSAQEVKDTGYPIWGQ